MKQALITLILLNLALLTPFSLACAQRENTSLIRNFILPKEVPPDFDTRMACIAASVDGQALTYRWTADNGTMRGDGSTATWLAPQWPGIYKIEVKVTDAHGRTATQQSAINVAPLTVTDFLDNPEIKLQVPVPCADTIIHQAIVRPLSTIDIQCGVPANSAAEYKYIWSCNGGKLVGQMIKEGKASRVGWTAPGTFGNYTVNVELTDKDNNRAIASAYFQVARSTSIGGGCGCGKK